MGPFRELCTVVVEHMFFAPDDGASEQEPARAGICHAVAFHPTGATTKRIGDAGILQRDVPGGIRLFCDDSRRDALISAAASSPDGLQLTFELFSRDRLFANYTRPAIPREDAILYFSNRSGNTDSAGATLLHAGEVVGENDFAPLDTPLLAGEDITQLRRRNPLAVVELALPAPGADATLHAGSFHIRFATRETFWKYYLLGGSLGTDVYIADLDSQTDFEALGEETLADDNVALTFRSTRSIPLHHRFERRFQYRSPGNGSDKVLIQRLPVASAERIDSEVVGGRKAAVSSIYVSC